MACDSVNDGGTGPLPDVSCKTLCTKEVLSYCWDWFEYHAGQRVLSFRYFAILMGIFAVGFANGLDRNSYVFLFCVAIAAALASLAFLYLDIRNEQLVSHGKNALLSLEASAAFSGYPEDVKIFHRDLEVRNGFVSHGFWYSFIYGTSAFFFFVLSFIISTHSVFISWIGTWGASL